jgi:3-phosphoshikimate 1-carboxyvinyltransferase
MERLVQVLRVEPTQGFDLVLDSIASDKSISHRCAMFSMLSDKPSTITNYLQAEDTLNSLQIIQDLGAVVEVNGNVTTITPPKKPLEPQNILDCGNSGTGMRLFSGLLAAFDGSFVLVGDEYLHRRPMKRVTVPLKSVGAQLDGRDDGNYAPLHIRGGTLNAFNYESSIASAQVKSAMILAALKADGVSTYHEPELTRDHTERMLKGMGVNISRLNHQVTIEPIKEALEPLELTVPSDPSSAFFFAVAAAITPGAKVIIKGVTLNPTRVEAYHVLKRMGAKVEFHLHEDKYEPMGDISVNYAPLNAVEVSENISWLIDELPALSIAFSVAKGTSVVKNAEELRVKESDRISAVVSSLNRCGVKTTEYEDGYTVTGGVIQSATIDSFGDHRIAMSFLIAGLLTPMTIQDTECIQTSFPNFIELLSKITKVNES